jgi:hypothetical protein
MKLAKLALAVIVCAVPLLVLHSLVRENISEKAPLGKIIRVAMNGDVRANVRAIRLLAPGGKNTPLDPELSRIKLLFDSDLPEILGESNLSTEDACF